MKLNVLLFKTFLRPFTYILRPHRENSELPISKDGNLQEKYSWYLHVKTKIFPDIKVVNLQEKTQIFPEIKVEI